MFADIAHGHAAAADVLFLVAAVLFTVAAVGTAQKHPAAAPLAYVAAACTAVALLILW